MHADVKVEGRGRGCGDSERIVGGGRGGSGWGGRSEENRNKEQGSPTIPRAPPPPPTHKYQNIQCANSGHGWHVGACARRGRGVGHTLRAGQTTNAPQAPKPAGSWGRVNKTPCPCTLCNANPRALDGSSSSKIFKQLETVQAATGTGRAGGKLEHTTRTVAPSASPVPQYPNSDPT